MLVTQAIHLVGIVPGGDDRSVRTVCSHTDASACMNAVYYPRKDLHSNEITV